MNMHYNIYNYCDYNNFYFLFHLYGVNSLSLVSMLLMERNVLAYGINTELKMTMDFAKLALKMKNWMS